MHLTFPIRSDKLSMNVLVTEHIAHRETEFQTIDIYDTEVFGKVLFLDGHVQLAEMDEHAYHESLVHIPLLSVESPKRALVVGGGDGGVLRELIKHESLEHIDMVEIDRGVVEVCREHMPEVSGAGFDDPRVHLHIADAFPFVKQVTDRYDLIVMDSTDTYEEEDGALSEQLFTESFYQDCRRALSDNGILVTQADNLVFCPYSLESIQATFAQVFDKTGSYQAIVPSFGGFSGFAWASNGATVSSEWRGPEIALRYLNKTTFALAFQPLSF
jgi:spermidine synthase